MYKLFSINNLIYVVESFKIEEALISIETNRATHPMHRKPIGEL